MSIIAITIDGPLAVIDCPPSVGRTLHNTSATYSHERRLWLLPTHDVPSFTEWLQTQGHLIILANPRAPDPRLCPHGLMWGDRLNEDHASIGGCNQCEWRMPDNSRLAAPHEPSAIPFTWGWWVRWSETNQEKTAARAALHHTQDQP